jgi:hypothetical protein
LEYIILEVGIDTNITNVDFTKYNILATNSLIKSTWSFLYEHKIIIDHNITVPKNTIYDNPIMAQFIQVPVTLEEISALNQCRLYLQAYFISDLATASGETLSHHAWEGTRRIFGKTNHCKWPEQGNPSKASWDIWRKFVKSTLLARGLRLKKGLGLWLRKDLDIWQGYFSPSLDGLVQIKPDGTKLLHSRHIPIITVNNFKQIGTPINQLPTDLQKASVTISRKNTWRLIDTGNFVYIPETPSFDNFCSYLAGNPPLNPWCFKDIVFPDILAPLLQDLENGTVRLVCDGSFDPSSCTGAAAWVLEGVTSDTLIEGKIVTPGEPIDHSAYRSELAGILAAMSVLNAVASFYGIRCTITVHCDCKSAIERAFSSIRPIKLHDASHDLLHAIQHEKTSTYITWSGQHISGHQDELVPFAQLDRISQLNVLVDHQAKDMIQQAMISTKQRIVYSPSWRIRLGSTPIIHDIDQVLYDLVHAPSVKQYWIQKGRITGETFSTVNWNRLGQALNKMSLSRRLFCSKHTSGMCGVGKFQKLWRMRETDACPHCRLFEDALHIWTCAADTVADVWSKSLLSLRKTLQRLDTDPELISLMLTYLKTWREGGFLQRIPGHQYHALLGLQETIGARQFFEGWMHTEWEHIQHQYYLATQSSCSSKRWTIAIITKMWEIAWDLWDFRNAVYHHQQNHSLEQDTAAIDLKIRDMYNNLATTELLLKDKHLSDITLQRLLLFQRIQKVEWLEQATLALAQAKTRYYLTRRT